MLHLFFEGWCCVWAHLLISNVTVLCTEPAVSQPSYDWRSSNWGWSTGTFIWHGFSCL